MSKRGGGVCLYSRNSFLCTQIMALSSPPPYIECIWSLLPLCKITLLALYVPPNLSVAQYSEIVEYIISEADTALNLVEGCKLMIVGDVNHLPTSDLETTLNLSQMVKVPTRGGSILDKIFIDQTLREDFQEPITMPNFGNSDHMAVYMKPVQKKPNQTQIKKVFDYRDSNIATFVETLKSQPWQRIYQSKDSIDLYVTFSMAWSTNL